MTLKLEISEKLSMQKVECSILLLLIFVFSQIGDSIEVTKEIKVICEHEIVVTLLCLMIVEKN